MKSTTICKECLRASRASPQVVRAPLKAAIPSVRAFSSQAPWRQQQPQQQTTSTTPPPPTSTSAPPSSSTTPPSNSSTDPPVAQMQAHIRTSLSHSPGMVKIAQALSRVSPSTTNTYQVYGSTLAFFKSCGAQAPYTIPDEQRTQIVSGRGPPKTAAGEDIGVPDESSTNVGSVFWHDNLGLLPTFSTWSQVTYLHFYILLVHLRTLEDYSSLQMHQRYLLEHFSQNAEDKMVLLHTIEARGIRNRYLKDLFMQWRGCIAAYDEGLVKGDAVLGAAVWRNLFKGEEDVDWVRVGVVVAYIRRCLALLGDIEGPSQMLEALDGPEGVWARAKVGLSEEVDKESEGLREAI